MTSHSRIDVLICGAGACGLTLAIELARRGVTFRLIDKISVPFPGSRGKGIQPRTQEMFEDIGVLDRVVAAGGLYPRQRRYRDNGNYTESDIAEQVSPTSEEPYSLPLMVPQFTTERILRERLNELGHNVEFGCRLTGFVQNNSHVTARLSCANENESTVHACYLVGADGGRSLVRKTLGVDFPGKTLNVHALVADVVLTGLSRDVWHQFGEGDMQRMLTICPLAGTGLFQIQAPVLPDAQTDLSAGGLTALIATRTGRQNILVQSVAWASDYHMNARLAERYRVGRVFLAGDAAHVHPPTGGQGLNTSVQDASNLAWKLAASLQGAREDLLDSYETERRQVAADMLCLSTRLLDEHRQRGSFQRGRDVRQLDIGYPESPLSKELPERTAGLRAGDRAPDARFCGAAGQPSRLFLLFRGPHWTLLVCKVAGVSIRPRPGLHIHYIGLSGDVIDTWGEINDTYTLRRDECVLIRPDGYIGAFFHTDHTAKFDLYMARMGVHLLPTES
ncbi:MULTISPECIES: FAD-dependent oxidoreductase [unclassified Citrobacter]|uniref:FAD-dependent oxidoreductase n=1 Tax=unclassified Citrobacter TaxID=2644389 RepID=UPI00230377F0|nr:MULTISPECIES: FAD-dependent oxidoreductase [unclassified Citrobacter]MDA8514191.1 FAD-dependent oxidoreductase [Citrobacter sp. Igbk 14]MDA8517767.1 FAD-dependent oxidoreductase [Citrobacter sp. Igbk 16]